MIITRASADADAHTRMLGQSTWLVVGCKVCRCCVGEFRGMQEGSVWWWWAEQELPWPSPVWTLPQVPAGWHLSLSWVSACDYRCIGSNTVIVCWIKKTKLVFNMRKNNSNNEKKNFCKKIKKNLHCRSHDIAQYAWMEKEGEWDILVKEIFWKRNFEI